MLLGTASNPIRFSYIHVFQPHKFEDSDELQYHLTVLIDKNNTTLIKEITDELTKLCKTEKGKNDLPKGYEFKISDFLNDGDDPKNADKEGYAGHYYRRFANSIERPPERYVSKNGAVVEMITPKEVKSGDFGIVNVSPFTYGNGKPKKGVSASLQGILKIKDGDALGSLNDSKSAFEGLLGATPAADVDPMFG